MVMDGFGKTLTCFVMNLFIAIQAYLPDFTSETSNNGHLLFHRILSI